MRKNALGVNLFFVKLEAWGGPGFLRASGAVAADAVMEHEVAAEPPSKT
jgi:hypothetical protein